jgi:hypothetical protein
MISKLKKTLRHNHFYESIILTLSQPFVIFFTQ